MKPATTHRIDVRPQPRRNWVHPPAPVVTHTLAFELMRFLLVVCETSADWHRYRWPGPSLRDVSCAIERQRSLWALESRRSVILKVVVAVTVLDKSIAGLYMVMQVQSWLVDSGHRGPVFFSRLTTSSGGEFKRHSSSSNARLIQQ